MNAKAKVVFARPHILSPKVLNEFRLNLVLVIILEVTR
jgi:hypothetical protein